MMDSLETLYDYTVFHIGLYFTVAGGVVAFLNLDMFSRGVSLLTRLGLITSIGLLIVAGAFGSLVASSITRTTDELDAFLSGQVGPIWNTDMMPTTTAIMVEHGAFWAAIFFLFLTIATAKRRPA